MLGGRPGGSSSWVPITQEDADSPQANRHRSQGPLDTTYAPSEGAISELSFSYDPNELPRINLDLLEMEDKSQGPDRLHQPPLQSPATGPDWPAQAQPARQAQDAHQGSSPRAQTTAAATYLITKVGAFRCRLKKCRNCAVGTCQHSKLKERTTSPCTTP